MAQSNTMHNTMNDQENTEPRRNFHLMQTPILGKVPIPQMANYTPLTNQMNFHNQQSFYQPSAAPSYILMPPVAPSPFVNADVNNNPTCPAANPTLEAALSAVEPTTSALSAQGWYFWTFFNFSFFISSLFQLLFSANHARAAKRSLNFEGQEPSAKTAKPNFQVEDVPVEECFSIDERIAVELDLLILKYDLESALTLSERTRLHRFLLTYLLQVKNPPCTEYEVNNMTVHAAIQVIHRATYDTTEILPLRLERYDGDLEKNLHMVDKRVIRSLEVYWLEVCQ